jgi:hypothetical protein
MELSTSFAEFHAVVHDVLAPRAGLEEIEDEQLSALSVGSQEIEREAAQNLAAGDPDVRELAALQLAAGAALDLALAADLFERDEGGAALAAPPSRFDEVHAELQAFVDPPAAVGLRSLVETPTRPAALEDKEALERLAAAADEAIDGITKDAMAIAGYAVDGLVDLGAEAVLGGLGAAAEQLVPQLYRRAKRFARAAVRQVMKAVSKLMRLLGPLEPKVRKWLAEKLGDATKEKLTAFAVDVALETSRLRRDVTDRIAATADDQVDEGRVDAAADEAASLAARFGRHELVIKVLAKVLGWVRPKLVALASWAAAAVAGVYGLALGYGVWVGGDYLDWYRTEAEGRLDLVDGVRTTVLGALPAEG